MLTLDFVYPSVQRGKSANYVWATMSHSTRIGVKWKCSFYNFYSFSAHSFDWLFGLFSTCQQSTAINYASNRQRMLIPTQIDLYILQARYELSSIPSFRCLYETEYDPHICRSNCSDFVGVVLLTWTTSIRIFFSRATFCKISLTFLLIWIPPSVRVEIFLTSFFFWILN